MGSEVEVEARRLFSRLEHVGWSEEDCALIAPMTLEINKLKQEQDAVILAHSYQTPDIMYGVADHIGDSYGLSVLAQRLPQKKIIFCSVHFMGETAKILSPEKDVLVPKPAGCSLAESISPEDVRALRAQHPSAGVVAYVNTSAAVKAEADVCCTSANVVEVVAAMPQQDIIFIPDEYIGLNLRTLTQKNIILWQGRCIVHKEFSPETVAAVREQFPGVKILAHTECSPAVVARVDFAGSTSAMMNYIKDSSDEEFMLATECGLTDRIRTEFPQKHIVGSCGLCPYMKEIALKDILTALKAPTSEQIITIPEATLKRARRALDKMFALTAHTQHKKAKH